MNTRSLQFSVITSLCVLATGCAAPAGPLSLSLNELGSEVREDAGSFFGGLSHRRSHNVTGLGASDTIGMLSSDPDPPLLFSWPNLLSRPNLPDQLALRINADCSKVIVRDIAGAETVTPAQVLEVRNALQDAETAAFRLLRAEAEALVVAEIVRQLDSSDAPAPAVGSASEAAASAQGSNARALADKALLASLVRGWTAIGSGTATPEDLTGWRARATALETMITELRKEREKSETVLTRARAYPGIVIARWEYAASRDSGFEAAGVSAGKARDTRRTGFVVLGHPRTLTLSAGDDLSIRACRASDAHCEGVPASDKRSGIDSLFKPSRLYTTTFQLLARHVAWAESGLFAEQSAFGVQLKKLLESLSAAPSGLRSTVAALDARYAAAQQMRATVSNMGMLSGGREIELPFSFVDDEEFARSVSYVRAYNGGFLQLSSMRSTLDDHAMQPTAALPKSVDRCLRKAPTVADLELLIRSDIVTAWRAAAPIR